MKYAELLAQPVSSERPSQPWAQLLVTIRHELTESVSNSTLPIADDSADLLQLLKHMFQYEYISRQKHGVIFCLGKDNGYHIPDGYLPISLLNTKYNILVRIMASCLRPVFGDKLKDSQFCRVTCNSILDAIPTVRDVLAHYNATGTPLCILTFYFNSAFDLFSTNTYFTVFEGME